MKKNMGNLDRVIRLIIVAVIAVLFYTGTISGALGVTLLVVAAIFAFTSFTGWCAIYAITGLKTCKIDESK